MTSLTPLREKIKELEAKPQNAEVPIESVRRMLLRILADCERETSASNPTFRINQEKLNKVRELLSIGLTDRAAAEETGVSINTVARIRKLS